MHRKQKQQVGLHQTKELLRSKGIKGKRQPVGLEKVFVNRIFDERLNPKYIRNLYNTIVKKEERKEGKRKREREAL